MSNEKFQHQYRIPSTRATWHHYGGGAYFVTVCTKNHGHYLGNIFDGVMHLSKIGECLSANLQHIADHYPYTDIPLFIVMPNHWHAIVFIDGNKIPNQRRNKNWGDEQRNIEVSTSSSSFKESFLGDEERNIEASHHPLVQTGRAPSLHLTASPTDSSFRRKQQQANNTINEIMRQTDSYKGWLSVAVGGLKAAVTKFARENNFDFAWLPRFDDHIIRTQKEMNRIADYIENNVARWNDDCFNDDVKTTQ
jgi:REP element-mobilizing transposase RayT